MVTRTLDYAGPKTNPRRPPWKRPVLSNAAGTLILACMSFVYLLPGLVPDLVLRAWLHAAMTTIALTQLPNARRWFKWAYPPAMLLFLSMQVGLSECIHHRLLFIGPGAPIVLEAFDRGPCHFGKRIWRPLLPWEWPKE